MNKSIYELKCSKEFSKAFKEHASKHINLHQQSKENRIIERIEKYIKSDEAIKENFNFCYKYLENIIINFIIDNYFKEKYQRINLFTP